MEMDLSPEHVQFREEVIDFLENEMPADLRRDAKNGHYFEHARVMEWHRQLYEKGWIAPNWPEEYGGTGWDVTRRFIFARGDRACEHAGALAVRPRHGRAAADRVRHRRTEAALPAEDPVGRRVLVPGLLGTERGLRPRIAAVARRQGWRRLHPERPEDLDDERAVRRLDLRARAHEPGRAQAGRHLVPARRHQQHRRHRREAVPHHRRHDGVLGDVVQGRARAADEPRRPRERRLDDGKGTARPRAHGHRRRLRILGLDHAREAHRVGRRRSARARCSTTRASAGASPNSRCGCAR